MNKILIIFILSFIIVNSLYAKSNKVYAQLAIYPTSYQISVAPKIDFQRYYNSNSFFGMTAMFTQKSRGSDDIDKEFTWMTGGGFLLGKNILKPNLPMKFEIAFEPGFWLHSCYDERKVVHNATWGDSSYTSQQFDSVEEYLFGGVRANISLEKKRFIAILSLQNLFGFKNDHVTFLESVDWSGFHNWRTKSDKKFKYLIGISLGIGFRSKEKE